MPFKILIGASESANVWKEILANLKERGVKEVLLFVSDGLTGLENAISEEFPKAQIQLCVVHQTRNTLNHVRPKDKDILAGKLKEIYKSKSLPEAKERLVKLNETIKSKYPRLLTRWFDKIEYLMRFLVFPEYLQPHLYSTNWLERLNKDFRKVLKNKNSMPTEDSVRKPLYSKVKDLTGRYERQRLNGFALYQVDLEILWQKYYRDNRFTQNT